MNTHVFYSRETREDQLSSRHDQLAPDALMTPILWHYNSIASEANPRVLVVGDMPLLIQKEMAARAMPLTAVQSLFQKSLRQWSKGNLGFSPELVHKEVFVIPRVRYMTEVIRQLAHSSKKVMVFVDSELQPYLEQ